MILGRTGSRCLRFLRLLGRKKIQLLVLLILPRTNAQAYASDEFSRLVVLTREDGTRITVEDIATVTDGFDETPIIARFNGRRAIAIDVYRSGDQDVIEIQCRVCQ